VAQLIPKDGRTDIMGHLPTIVRSTFNLVEPQEAVMFTMEPGLPAKALAKFQAIAAVIESLRYNITFETYRDRQVWRYDKKAGRQKVFGDHSVKRDEKLEHLAATAEERNDARAAKALKRPKVREFMGR
jgi:hypothetical protein